MLFDLLLVGSRSTISPVCLQIYNNLNDVSVNSVHCHAYVAASRLSSIAKVCACTRYSFIPRVFSDKNTGRCLQSKLLHIFPRGLGSAMFRFRLTAQDSTHRRALDR